MSERRRGQDRNTQAKGERKDRTSASKNRNFSFVTVEPKTCVSDEPSGTKIFVLKSHPLRKVPLYQNTHSSNFVLALGSAVRKASDNS